MKRDYPMRIKNKFPLRGTAVPLVLSFIATLPAAVQAVDVEALLPRPGLYRVDLDGTVTMPVGSASTGFRHRTDGSTGDLVAHQFANGERTADQLYKGNKPVTVCVPPRTKGQAADLASMGLPGKLAACPDQATTYTKDGYIHTANCPASKTIFNVKKINADTWDYTIDVTTFQTAAGPDMSGMRMVAENMAKNGATAEDREKGRKALAELPEMQRKMTQGLAETIAAMKEGERKAATPEEAAQIRSARENMTGKREIMQSTGKERWTRVGDRCES